MDINYDKCMSRCDDNILHQCNHYKITTDYCSKHIESSNILRIDTVLPEKQINKLLKLNTNDLNTNDLNIEYQLLFDEKVLEKIKKVAGPCYKNPLLSHNNIDPISQENIWITQTDNIKILAKDIPYYMLFSYKDDDGFIRCFNIESIKGLIDENIFKHPVTGKQIPANVIENAKTHIEILQNEGILNNNISITNNLTEESIKQLVFEIFAKFHPMNIYLKDEWFLNLSIEQLNKMYYETREFFAQNITASNKIRLVPPNGIAFDQDPDELKTKDKIIIQHSILTNIDKIISLCDDKSLQTMGAYIALGGIATVSEIVRECYPHIAYTFM